MESHSSHRDEARLGQELAYQIVVLQLRALPWETEPFGALALLPLAGALAMGLALEMELHGQEPLALYIAGRVLPAKRPASF